MKKHRKTLLPCVGYQSKLQRENPISFQKLKGKYNLSVVVNKVQKIHFFQFETQEAWTISKCYLSNHSLSKFDSFLVFNLVLLVTVCTTWRRYTVPCCQKKQNTIQTQLLWPVNVHYFNEQYRSLTDCARASKLTSQKSRRKHTLILE